MPNYYKYATHRQNRLRFDELVLDFLLAWLQENKKQFHQIYNYVFRILEPYRQRMREIRRKKDYSRVVEVHSLKIQVIDSGYKLLRLYKILLEYPNFAYQIDEESIK